ncbi:MAG TPA: hypothetical protein VHP30_03330, partial [Ignavibacteriales bacterium]|nr:hypothetical protein [Ignavibacteriales bacterium]
SYYRRVVENKRNKIIEKLIDVLDLTNDPDKTHKKEILGEAKKDTQFKNSIEKIKDGIPETLYLQGQNPFTLLHSPLSEGLHGKSDEECLEWATDIRTILVGFVERLNYVLQDDNKMTEAINRLTNRNNKDFPKS